MVTEPTSLFDLYYLMVEVVFGSVILSIVVMAAFIIITMLLGKSSMGTIIVWLVFYIGVMTIMYFGALGLVLAFLFAFMYFGTAVVKFLMEYI